MPTKIIKNLSVSAPSAFFLLHEVLTHSLGWTDVETNPPLALVSSGVDGEALTSQPDRFRSGSNPFTVADVGRWLVLSDSEFVNNGVYKIAGVPSAGELILSSGLYGASLVDATNINFRVVDPTASVVGDYFVVAGLSGSSIPWQARFVLSAPDTISIEVSPNAGWVAGAWSVTVPPTVMIAESVGNPSWYFLIDDTHIRMWTQNALGTGVNEMAYVGSAESRRPTSDQQFVVSLAGTTILDPTGALATIGSLDDSLTTTVPYSAITYGMAAMQNAFVSLPASSYDLRNDSAKIPVGTDAAGFVEDDRGYLRGLHYISDLIPYRSFVDNGRSLLSIGDGLAVEWDGSLSR